MSLRLKESEIDGKQGDSGEGASYLISDMPRRSNRDSAESNCRAKEL